MLKRDLKGRFLKKKEEQKEKTETKRHAKIQRTASFVQCYACGMDYKEKRLPLMQKRTQSGEKTGIYFCKAHMIGV